VHSIASPVEKKDTMPKTALDIKEKEEQELKPTLLTLTWKKICYMKGVKLKGVEWL
jgi:hypothetical protein